MNIADIRNHTKLGYAKTRLIQYVFIVVFLLLSTFFKTNAQAPVISYTPLANTCTPGAKTLIATITCAAPYSIPTSGNGLPVLYWSFNASSDSVVQGVYLGANQYSFTFAYTPSVGSVISYFIVAQNNAPTPQVTIFPSANGASVPTAYPPAVTQAPTTQDYYINQATLSGTFLVGAGQSASGGFDKLFDAVNAYNTSCLNGAVTFLLTDPTYDVNESFPIRIKNSQASATNTLTIKLNTGVSSTAIKGKADAIFKFEGADYVTIDGYSATQSSNAFRGIKIINDSISSNASAIWMASFSSTDGCTYNNIKNCVVSGVGSSSSFAAIALSSNSMVSANADAPHSNNTFINNEVSAAQYGFFMNGAASGNSNNIIRGNKIGSTITNSKIGYRSLYAANELGLVVDSNLVTGLNSSFYSGADADASGGIILAGSTSGANIVGNTIYDLKNTFASGAPCYGISLQTANSSSSIKIYNNWIYNVTAAGNSAAPINNGIGIAVISGGGYGIYFNSVLLSVNQTNPGTSSCLYVSTNIIAGSLDVRNNIFSNRENTGTRYAVYCYGSSNVFTLINNNDYHCPNIPAGGYIGFIADPINNIATWQALTAGDGNSVAVDPVFVAISATPFNLHLSDASPLNNQGVAISGITIDIDKQTRGAIPDIGADEFTPPACVASAVAGTVTPVSSILFCQSGQPVMTCSGFGIYGTGAAYQWEQSINGGGTWTSVAGETNPVTSNPPVINTTTQFRLKSSCGATVLYTTPISFEVKNPQIITTSPASRCGTGAMTIGATPSTGTTVQWYTTPTGGTPIATGNTYNTPVLNGTTTYYAEPTYIGSSGSCGPANPAAAGGTISPQLTPWKVFFDVLQSTTIISVDIFPIAANETFAIEVYSSTNLLLGSIPFTTNVSGGATPQTIPINVFMLPGTDYYLTINAGDLSSLGSGLNRSINPPGVSFPYPYTSSDIQINGNEFRSDYYMCFFNWKFYNGCTVTRTPVAATISNATPIILTANPPSFCQGSSAVLSATSTNSSYSYAWSPISYVGNSVTVAPTTTTTYKVTATAGACVKVDSITVTVNQAPAQLVFNIDSTNRCTGKIDTLTTTGGTLNEAIIFSENFNGTYTGTPALPTGWSSSYDLTGDAGAWKQQNNGYSYQFYTFRSNDSSKFFMSNSFAVTNGGPTAILYTPKISLSGYTNVWMSFWHHYQIGDGVSASIPEIVAIERSSTPSVNNSWQILWSKTNITNTGSIGQPYSFVKDSINLTPFTVRINGTGSTYNNPDSVYLRFRYVSKQDWWWAIDNINIKGQALSPIIWTPTTGLYTNAAATTAYTGTTATTLYANPTTNTTYIASATTPNGCSVADTVKIKVKPAVTATLSSVSSICTGSSTNLSLAVTGTGPWTCTLRRTVGTTNTDTTFTIVTSPVIIPLIPAATNVYPSATTIYSVLSLVDGNSSCGLTLPSNKDTIVVLPGVTTATITRSGTGSICRGSVANIKVGVAGTSVPYMLVYSSFVPSIGTVRYDTVQGVINNQLIPVYPTDTTTYTIVNIFGANGCGAASPSGSFTVNVVQLPTPGTITPALTSICTTTTVPMSLSGNTGTIKWMRSLDGGLTWAQAPGTATGVNYSAANVSQTSYYHVVLSSAALSSCKDSTANAIINFGTTLNAGNINGSRIACSGTNSTLMSLSGNSAGTIQWQSTTDSINVPFSNITGATTSTYTANNIPDTMFYRVALSASCGGSSTTVYTPIFTVLFYPRPTATLSGATTICSNGSASLMLHLNSMSPWNITYTANGSNPVTINNIRSADTVLVVSPTTTTNYLLSNITDSVGCAATVFPSPVTITVNTPSRYTWTGNISSDWNNNNNWCGGIPSTTQDADIPSGLPNYPVITGNSSCHHLSIASGASLTISNGGAFNITGVTTNSGIIRNKGILRLSGTESQSFPGVGSGIIDTMNILEIDKSSGIITFDKKFAITDSGVLRFKNAGIVNINDTLTIKSTANGTARIDSIPNTVQLVYNNTGCFTVEKYIATGSGAGQHGKSWQLLSTPTYGQTIRQAWQEGAVAASTIPNPKPGYGTTITSNFGSSPAGAYALGFDFYTPSGTTMKCYDNVTNTYIGVPNTNSTQIANPKGYMFFVRGDRSVTSSSTPAVPVTLRTTGKLFYGSGTDAASSVSVTAGSFQTAGNPYASPIDYRKVLSISTGINPTFYVWDPTLQGGLGLGAIQTISQFSGWKPVPGGSTFYDSTVAYPFIQSGQAFFFYSATGGTIRFAESNKVAGNRIVQRGSDDIVRPLLKANILSPDGKLLDGNLLALDSSALNGADAFDVPKISNFGENLGINNYQQSLAIDARQQLHDDDTIFYKMYNLRQQNYQLQLLPEHMDNLNLTAYLVDKYLHTSQPVSLSQSQSFPFEITADPLSKSNDRFMVVFKLLRALPVNFTQITANWKGDDAEIKWNVSAELEVKHYVLERSCDGSNFSAIGEINPIHNNGTAAQYASIDNKPFEGCSYYRVRCVDVSGLEKLSSIVKLCRQSSSPQISIFPNPVVDNIVHLQFKNIPASLYTIELLDEAGKLVDRKQILHNGTNATYALQPGKLLPAGTYMIRYKGGKLPEGVVKLAVAHRL